jgi:hypothetical protein
MSIQTQLFQDVHQRLINAIQGGRDQAAYNWTRILVHMVAK